MNFDDDMDDITQLRGGVSIESAGKIGKKAMGSHTLEAYYRLGTDGSAQWAAKHVVIELEEKMFLRKYSTMIGDKIDTMGFFMIYIWDKVEFDHDHPSKSQPDVIFKYNLPTSFMTAPSEIETITRQRNGAPLKIKRLHYENGDKFFINTEVKQDKKNAVNFVQMIFNNDIPDDVKIFGTYTDLFLNNAKLNGINYGVNAARFEMLEAALVRSAADPSKPYRLHKEGGMTGARIVDMPGLLSTFGAASFRDPISSFTAGINRARDENAAPEDISPVEKTMKY